MVSVTIGIPYLDVFYPDFVFSFLALEKPSFQIASFRGCYLDESRNNITKSFLNHPAKPTHLLFMDTDTLPPKDGLKKLVKTGKDIVGGLYFSKNPPFKPVAYRKKDNGYVALDNYEKDKIIEVDAIGCGFLLIKREVFGALKEKVNFIESKKHHEFFSFKEGFGEDLYFCKKAQESGFSIHCDTSVICRHLVLNGVDDRHFKSAQKK